MLLKSVRLWPAFSSKSVHVGRDDKPSWSLPSWSLPFWCALVLFASGALPRDEIADRRSRTRSAGGWLFVGFHFRAGGFFAYGANAEADFLFFRVHLHDLEVEFLARLKFNWRALVIGGLRVMAEAFDAFGDVDEGSKCCYPDDLSVHDVADLVVPEEGLPSAGLGLLPTQRQAAVIGVPCPHAAVLR